MLLLAGCGGHGDSLARGRGVFMRSCAGCHSLTGGNTHAPGGDLAVTKLSERDIAGFVRIMPVRLSAADASAVAAYVHTEAGRLGR